MNESHASQLYLYMEQYSSGTLLWEVSWRIAAVLVVVSVEQTCVNPKDGGAQNYFE